MRARTKNLNGWSPYCERLHSQTPMVHILQFDVDHSSHSNGITYDDDNKCILFAKTYQHNIAVLDIVIDESEYDTFEWKCVVNFEGEDDDETKKKRKKKRKTKRDRDIFEESEKDEICMGFVGYPLNESVEFMDSQLGRNGNQYGLMVSNDSRSAHVYFTKNDNIHHASEILLHQKVKNEDEFRFLCNLKKRTCDIYHNDELLSNVFSSNIPKRIIPAVSGYSVDQSLSCSVEFVSAN